MKRAMALSLLPLLAIADTAQAELLKTMPHGPYECALPGDASGLALIPVAEESFTITRASRYRTENGRGTYLLRGDTLTFTGGPKNGQQLRRTGTNELRILNQDGTTGRMICARVGTNY